MTACYGGERRQATTATIERKWPAAALRQLEVNEVDGNVSITAVPGNEVTLVARVRARGVQPKPNAENQGYFQSHVTGDILVIGREDHDDDDRIPFLFRRNSVSIDYELRVPARIALDLRTVNGRIVTRGMEGETEAVTVNGPLDLETAGTHGLSANAVNGSIKVKFLHSFQGAKFKTINGAVEARLPQDASFSVDLSQVNGDFEASFPLSIHSNPGSRRVSGEVNGGRHELKIVTVNGDVEVLHLPVPPAPPAAPATPAAAPPATPVLPVVPPVPTT